MKDKRAAVARYLASVEGKNWAVTNLVTKVAVEIPSQKRDGLENYKTRFYELVQPRVT